MSDLFGNYIVGFLMTTSYKKKTNTIPLKSMFCLLCLADCVVEDSGVEEDSRRSILSRSTARVCLKQSNIRKLKKNVRNFYFTFLILNYWQILEFTKCCVLPKLLSSRPE